METIGNCFPNMDGTTQWDAIYRYDHYQSHDASMTDLTWCGEIKLQKSFYIWNNMQSECIGGKGVCSAIILQSLSCASVLVPTDCDKGIFFNSFNNNFKLVWVIEENQINQIPTWLNILKRGHLQQGKGWRINAGPDQMSMRKVSHFPKQRLALCKRLGVRLCENVTVINEVSTKEFIGNGRLLQPY